MAITVSKSEVLLVERVTQMVISLNKVRLAIPNGHLNRETLEIFTRAGYRISGQERTYTPVIDDRHIELRILRPQEIPTFVEEGLQDIGVTGSDWLRETKAEVDVLLSLEYCRVRIAMAVHESLQNVESLSDLLVHFRNIEKPLRIFTEYLTIASESVSENPVYCELYGKTEPTIVTPWWRKGENTQVVVYLSFGATEAKPPTAADAIVEVVDTGTSLQKNGLKVIETLLESTAVLIANRDAMRDPRKREKMYDIMTLLNGVIQARRKLHLFVNVEKSMLQLLLDQLPALQKPTISPLSDENWVAVNTIVDRTQFLELVPSLRKLAQGLVVYEPRQVLPLAEIRNGSGLVG